ncbi:MAG: cytochrome c oxidase subunit 3 [Thermomicrobiales bacterium]
MMDATAKLVQDSGRGSTITRETLGNPPAWWAMIFVLFTEGALFASLLLAYFYERSNSPAWPPPGIEKPELLLPLIMTALLIGSSITMIWAELGIEHGSQLSLRLGLVLSFALAVSFLGLQAYEFSHQSFSLGNGVYSSAFFTITGLHGLHIAIVVVMGAVLVVQALLGHFTKDHHDPVRIVGLYWHFVDVVWIFILISLYISPYLL